MRTVYNNILPLKGFAAINLFGVLFVRKNVILTDRIVNHERIHTAQMKELWYVFFYVWYALEWLVKLFRYGSGSYRNVSFEREAYHKDWDLGYLEKRKRFGFLKYI